MPAFSEVSHVVPRGEGRFAGDVHPDWTIGDKPNGGYLLAMLGRAATAVSPHPHPVAASAHYLRPPEPGPVSIDVELLRGGRSASQLRARMVQHGQPCIEALLTTTTMEETTPQWTGAVAPRGELDFGECLRLPGQTPNGTPVRIMEQVEVRLEPESLGFGRGRPTGRGELRGWLALPEEEPFDPCSLLFAVDAFPPATFDVAPSGWVPTLELTVYVRARPAPGPVQLLHRAHLIDAQRVDEACWVWDSTGRLVAQATQLAGIRLG